MEGGGYDKEFWQFSDQLRVQTANFSSLSLGDSIWSLDKNSDRRNSDPFSSPINNDLLFFNNTSGGSGGWKNNPGLIGSGKLAFGTTTTNNADRYNYFPNNNSGKNNSSSSNNSYKNYNNSNNNNIIKSGNYFNNSSSSSSSGEIKNYFNKPNNNHHHGHGNGKKNSGDGGGKKKNAINSNNNNNNNSAGAAVDKRFKTLPASEALPRNEAIGGYIFVCNNDTMEENLKRQLFGLPSRYRDSVRAIRPGLPLFLYNYSTHQLHGIFQAASFGGTNIDPTAWEDKKCPGESRFPAQVRVATRKICDPLEEDAFRPILHHYDGPKFRLELSVPEALSLLDIFADKDA